MFVQMGSSCIPVVHTWGSALFLFPSLPLTTEALQRHSFSRTSCQAPCLWVEKEQLKVALDRWFLAHLHQLPMSRSTAFSLCSSQGCTPRDPRWRDTQVRERLNTARLLRKAVEQQFQARSPPCKEWSGGILQKLRKRVAMTEGLIQNLLRRIEGTGALIRRVDQSLYLLSQNRQSLDGPIEICERRLLIRTQRPEEESVQDDFQQALEHEEQVLASGNKHLNAYIEAGNQLHEALQAAKIEMVEDLQFKKHALRLEKSALQFDPYHGRDRACVLPMVADKGEMLQPQRKLMQSRFGKE
ncbi:unnamed protein product [Effrenium voratum]|nr:unnamed protein product [Effrenium voratum]